MTTSSPETKGGVLAWCLRLSLSAKIVLGLALGVATGLFFGEEAVLLEPLGDIYIRLMQMTVLPYVVVALIVAFGQLDGTRARRLAVGMGTLLLVTWGLTASVIVAIPYAFPDFQSASFFSESLISPSEPFSLTDLYFTTNPFESLANNVIPAVVLFSSMIGVSLIGMKNRDDLLGALRVLNTAIVRITNFVIRTTPIGVFAIAAVSAGTLGPETLDRLIVYFVAFGIAALLLAFVILPLMVTAVTPFRYGEVVTVAGDSLLTAFIVNNAFVVLPILIERSKTLIERHGLLDDESGSAAEIVVPILFNFPNAGRLLTLLFVPFAGWLSGAPFALVDYSHLFTVGIPTYFARAQVALPFLIDYFGMPHDLFQLYIPTAIVTGKFDSLVTAMNLLAYGLLGAAAMGGFLVLRARRIAVHAGVAAVALVAVTIGTAAILAGTVDTSYRMDEVLRRMHASRSTNPVVVHRSLESALAGWTSGDGPTLDRVRERQRLRVGYDPANFPFSFFNTDDELVGFDVELARDFADAIGVTAEFVPVTWAMLPDLLDEGAIDVMPGMWYRENWLGTVRLSEPYLTGTMGLAVRDERRSEVDTIEKLRQRSGLKIGVPLDARQVTMSLEHYFGSADVDVATHEFWSDFFEGRHPDLDAFVLPAENGSAWTLLHPEYVMVVPQPSPVRVPYAFGLAPGNVELSELIDEWVRYAESTGLVDSAYRYWILGEGSEVDQPRWSIMRNVLGWGD